MNKPNYYDWIMRVVDQNGERYELKLGYTLSMVRRLATMKRKQVGVLCVHFFKKFDNI